MGYMGFGMKKETYARKPRKIFKHLKNIYGDLSLPLANDMLPFLKKDKKNISDKLNCVLTKGPGDMFLYEVEYNDVITYIKKFK